jgi:hypothetical protein
MPPRGYNRNKTDKPIIQVQVKTAVSKLLGGAAAAPKPSITEAIGQLTQLFSGNDPDIVNNPNLQKQTIPDGWEAVTSIPEWATAGTRPEVKDPTNRWDVYNADRKTHPERINPTTLNHAIRIKGTNHILTSEVKLTGPQLERAAKDYKAAADAIGHQFPDGVAMHVPAASNFKARDARGYMRMSGGTRRTFYMNPKIIKRNDAQIAEYGLHQRTMRTSNWLSARSQAKKLGLPEPDHDDSSFGWSMPAANQDQKNGGAVYTMIHEMAHVLDDSKGHTNEGYSDKARAFHRDKKPRLSEYGKSKVVEGYAEAGAQWFLGGPGTSDVADNYAREYGWQAPPR